MSNESIKKKYGTHRRISDENIERIKRVGKMGDSVNKVIGRLLDDEEDIIRCLKGDEPQTKTLINLRSKWFDEWKHDDEYLKSFNEEQEN